ncbi:MAG TPA: indole-3-glycerol phosphate synthase TrpC [Hellea balneolensis]|uniref:Indole-3-glycerol phosphate synthase n=1 Tax=Hellea balneolensis TaxID=287478 RepID=A0A7C5QQ57_9PROT|nr:indole-3-glycerol phosphate synthase TrpC [Hellea balneolensis]
MTRQCTHNILSKIAAYKRKEVEAAKDMAPLSQLDRQIATMPEPRGFLKSLKHRALIAPALIAEIKKASPSKGLIREDFSPSTLARAYQDGGATCLSVLTDKPSFQGSNLFLKQAKAMSTLPVLRKDFMIDTYQIAESRMLGADCVLIIMAMIDDQLAADLYACAKDYGLDVLVEVHDEEELARACDLEPDMFGINNRDLKTFNTSLANFENLAPYVPETAFLVAESGIFTSDDLLHLAEYGAQGFLVGESLMRQNDVCKATRQLLGEI